MHTLLVLKGWTQGRLSRCLGSLSRAEANTQLHITCAQLALPSCVTSSCLMARPGKLSRYFAIRQQPSDKQDNSPAVSHTTYSTYTSYLPRTFDNPMPYSDKKIPHPVSDSNEKAGETVVAPRRSAPAISRFNPTVVGWLSITERLACRAAESVAFCVPDSNTLCSRASMTCWCKRLQSMYLL
jgi:hypothetical protein